MRNDVIIIAHVRINEVHVLCYRPTGVDTDGPCHEGGGGLHGSARMLLMGCRPQTLIPGDVAPHAWFSSCIAYTSG